MTAEEFNSKYPVGTKVTYHPIMLSSVGAQETHTRSAAWDLGDGTGVVKVKGVTGCVGLGALTIHE